MVLRTSTDATSNSLLNYIWMNQSRYNETAEQIATQKKLNRPSDNATDAISVLATNKQINQLNGYLNNMQLANNELNVTDSSMASIISSMQRVNDLTVQAASENTSGSSLANIKTEIDQITKNLVDLGNTQFNGAFIFSGTNTGTKPFVQAPDGSITYTGTPMDKDYQRSVEISDGVKSVINIPGDKLLGTYDVTTGSGSGIFKTLGDLSKSMGAAPPDYSGIRASLDKIKDGIDNTSSNRAVFASTVQRFNMTTTTINTNVVQLKNYRSDLQDTDLSQAASQLAQQKYALQATMAVATQTLQQTSLLNFMT